MAVQRTFYDILGVAQNASLEQIRQAYIRESLKFHPDRNPDEEASNIFQKIANAYFTLRFPLFKSGLHLLV